MELGLSFFYNCRFLNLIFLLLCLCGCCVGCEISLPEYQGLQSLYNSAAGDHWAWNLSRPLASIWNFPSSLNSPCMDNWQGLECIYVTPVNCSVVSLTLHNFNLNGSLPDQIGNFYLLESLNISGNYLPSQVPDSIGNLTSLKKLALNSNKIYSTIPFAIGNLVSLELLWLFDNKFHGEIPNSIGNLTNLLDLQVGLNQLEGSVPSDINNLQSLQILSLGENRLESIPFRSRFNDLELLNIEGNSIFSRLPSLYLFPNIKYLYFGRNAFYGRLPQSICSLQNLIAFSVIRNALNGTIPTCIGILAELEIVNFFDNFFGGPIPSQIGLLSNLTSFHAGYNHFSGSLPTEIGNLTSLRIFNVYRNNLTGTIPTEIGQMESLASLELSANNMYGSIPSTIVLLKNLKIIELNNNSFTGTLPPEIGQLTRLSTFYLNKNFFQGTIPPSFGNLTNLAYLDLSINRFIGTFPSTFGNLTSLLHLLVSTTKLTGTLPTQLCHLSLLQVLHIDYNRITGIVPACIGSLTNLRNLQLCCNGLYGSIPSEFHGLTKMQFFELSSTSISGPIPQYMQNWTSLVALYLQNTYIEGTIPNFISKFRDLGVLDLSSTNLIGSVPSTIFLLSNLEYLNLSYVCLPSTLDNVQSKLSSMRVFALTGACLSGSLPTSFGFTHKLQYFSVNSNSLTGRFPHEILPNRTLRVLDIGYNAFTGPVELERLITPSLQYLIMSNNLFTGTLPTNWSAFYNCLYVYVNNNFIHAQLPQLMYNNNSEALQNNHEFKNGSTVLLQFHASHNVLSGPVPTALWDNHHIEVISISNNHLSGSLQGDLTNLTSLTSLQLSNNRLTGNLYDAFKSALPSLQFINLGNNRLTGTIPGGIFNSILLQQIILSSNCFSGSLSADLCKATNLTSIILDSLSSNKHCSNRFLPSIFKGIVPSKKIIGSFPSCLLQLPHLTTLGLSGNDLFGTIPDTELSESIVSLRISFNAIAGTIPDSLQRRGNFTYLSFRKNKLTGRLLDNFAVGGPTIPRCNVTLKLDVNRLSGGYPSSFADIGTLNVVTGNMFDCDSAGNVPDQDPGADEFECGSKQFNDALLTWVSTLAVIVVLGIWMYVTRKYSSSNVKLLTLDFKKEGLRGTIFIATQNMNVVMKSVYENSSTWLGFDFESHRKTLFYTSQFIEMLKNAAKGSVYLAMAYIFCMFVYLYLKTSVYSEMFTTVVMQYGWGLTSVFLKGYFPAAFICVIVVFSTALVFFTIVRVGAMESTAEKLSIQREQWKATHRYAAHSESSAEYILDMVVLPALAQGINLVVTLSVNAAYLHALTIVSSQLVIFVQFAMSIFKLFWVNVYISLVIRRMQYLPAAIQFKHQVIMLIVCYVMGPGIISLTGNVNCFYSLFATPATIQAEYTEVESELSCITVFKSYYLAYAQEEVSDSKLTCKSVLNEMDVAVTTYAPFTYGYQCGSAFLIDYIPVLFYSYLVSALQMPLVKYVLMVTKKKTLKKWLGLTIYDAFIDNTILDTETGDIFPRQVSIEMGKILAEGQELKRTSSNIDLNSDFQLPRQDSVASEVSEDKSKEQRMLEKPLFNGSMFVAKRIMDVAVILTFGLACPLLAVTIAFSICINSLTWRLVIGKYLTVVGVENLSAVSRLENSCEGLFRGAVGALQPAIVVIAMFWGIMFYDMIADESGTTRAIIFVLSTFIGIPVLLFLIFLVRSPFLRWIRYLAERGTKMTERPTDDVSIRESRSTIGFRGELWNLGQKFTPAVVNTFYGDSLRPTVVRPSQNNIQRDYSISGPGVAIVESIAIESSCSGGANSNTTARSTENNIGCRLQVVNPVHADTTTSAMVIPHRSVLTDTSIELPDSAIIEMSSQEFIATI